jgi:hypothetical protein
MGLGGDGRCQPRQLAVRGRTGAGGMTHSCTSFWRCQGSHGEGEGRWWGGAPWRTGGGSGWSGAPGGGGARVQGDGLYMQRKHAGMGPVDRRRASVSVRPDDGGLPGGPKRGWTAAAQGAACGRAWSSRRLGTGRRWKGARGGLREGANWHGHRDGGGRRRATSRHVAASGQPCVTIST